MYAGAWLNLNLAPTVSLDWMAMGFLGAAMLTLENVFPALADRRV
jgi:hypothetical protein